MKKQIKKAVSWLLLVCMIAGLMPVFGAAAAPEEKSVQSFAYTDAAPAAQAEGELEELHADNLFDLLVETFKAIFKNLQTLSINEILNLPANSMDDVVTYIFAFLKLLGLQLDTIYEKIAAVF